MWSVTAPACRSKIDSSPEKKRGWSKIKVQILLFEDGVVDLVPLDTVDALAVQVEAAIENGRAPGLLERK